MQARDGGLRNDDLSPGQSIPLWGWVTEAEKRKEKISDSEYGDGTSDLQSILEEFKDRFPRLELVEGPRQKLVAEVKGKLVDLEFHIQPQVNKTGATYEIECVGNLKEHAMLTRVMGMRKAPGNLRYLMVCFASKL
jgi:hypothetical protein